MVISERGFRNQNYVALRINTSFWKAIISHFLQWEFKENCYTLTYKEVVRK